MVLKIHTFPRKGHWGYTAGPCPALLTYFLMGIKLPNLSPSRSDIQDNMEISHEETSMDGTVPPPSVRYVNIAVANARHSAAERNETNNTAVTSVTIAEPYRSP
jgi:hypothetical protein